MYVSPFERKSRAVAGACLVGGLCAAVVGWMLISNTSTFQAFSALGQMLLGFAWPLLALAAICLAPSLFAAGRHRRRRRRLPNLVLFAIAVNREIVEDAAVLSSQLFEALHPHAVEHPVSVYHVAEDRPGEEGRSYVFLVGVHRSIAEKAERTISSIFNGRGAVVREVELQNSPLFRPVYDAWTREEESHAQAMAEREAARVRARAAASHSDDGSVRDFFGDLDEEESAPTLIGVEG